MKRSFNLKRIQAIVACLFAAVFQCSAQTGTLATAALTGSGTLGEYYQYSNGHITLGPGFTAAPGSGQSFHAYIYSTDCIPIALNLSTAQNFVLTSMPRISGLTDPSQLIASGRTICDVINTIQYADGLGRPLQTVQLNASPTGRDIVQPFVYDIYGREPVKYLPYAASSANDGSYKSTALSGDQSGFYASPPAGVSVNSYPTANVNFEPSPLNRPVEQGAPGAAWQLGSGHTVTMAYDVNVASDIPMWQVTGGGASWGSTYYGAGTLTTTVTTDENGHDVTEYKDMFNRVVAKKVDNSGTYLTTSYVYDDYGNLAYVIPPVPGTYPASFSESDAVFNNFIYAYRYDTRNRVIRKKIPGKGWEHLVYNTIDQVVATQDSVQRNNSQWLFSKYDGNGRVVETGIWSSSTDRATLQSTINGYTTNLWETANGGSGNGYSNVAFPTSSTTALTLNYYDSYANAPGLPSGYSAPTGASTNTTGLLVAALTNVLGSSDMLWTVHYYDDLGRVVQSYAQHYLGGSLNAGNYDKIVNTYDFTNTITATTRQHYTTGGLALTVANTYSYDHMGRKTQTYEQINGGTNVLLSQTDYNEIGQVLNKHLHNAGSGFLQNMAYTYNERGWLKTAGAPLFAFQLNYNDGTTPQYNGNISNQLWGTPGSLGNSYTYSYDALNRLRSGIANTGNTEKSIVYDNLGNITGLQRYLTISGASTVVDELNYSYLDGGSNPTNRLYSITDSTSSDVGLKHGTFSYAYDGNGNMVTDNSKGLGITYNILNLPNVNTLPGGTVTYTYDATGRKLRKVSTFGSGSTTDYVSGIQYTNSSIDFIQTEEGRALNSGGNYHYEYNLADHLGNSRLSFDTYSGSTSTTQQDDYLPFGYEVSVGSIVSPKNEYLYNKKELQEELGQYDYGARFYDPVIGRFTTVDPLATKYPWYTPYQFAGNEVPNAIDRDGLEPAYPEAGGTTGRFVTARDGQLSRPLTNPDGAAYLNSKTTVGAGKAFGQYAGPYKEIVNLLGATGDAINTLSGNTPNTTTGDKAQAGIFLLQLAPMSSGEGGGAPEGSFPDNATVVRGGTNTPEQLSPKLEETHPSGVKGASVECGTCSVKELSKSIPHGKVGVTTVGDVRAAGGDVIKTSGNSPNHATMTGISPEAASRLLNPTIKNPSKP